MKTTLSLSRGNCRYHRFIVLTGLLPSPIRRAGDCILTILAALVIMPNVGHLVLLTANIIKKRSLRDQLRSMFANGVIVISAI
ncbi:hypothetical protein DJICPGNB_11795 [Escherichia coli]|nr:hypothetical protein DJICPGNB_11795 [Escherichia coli]